MPEARHAGIGVQEFADLYAAAEWAHSSGFWFDTTLTIAWRRLEIEDPADVQRVLTAFLKCLRDWLAQRCLPPAWIYAHECGPIIGLHTHLAIYIPGSVNADDAPQSDYRADFRAWVLAWVRRRMGRPVPRSTRVRGPRAETPWLHWLTAHYLMKGYDRGVEVQSSRTSPDGQPVTLGDLIVFDWQDPGKVAMTQRVGWSRPLGPGRRATGVPWGADDRTAPTWPLTDFSVTPPKDVFVPPVAGPLRPFGRLGDVKTPAALPRHGRPAPAFRSKFDEGVRDVRQLYPEDFLRRVHPLFYVSASDDEGA